MRRLISFGILSSVPIPRDPAPPPIAHFKAMGHTSVWIYCAGIYCSHSTVVAFDDLNLPDTIPLIEIGRHRNFVCDRCGSREVMVRPRFPDPRKVFRDSVG